MIVRGAFKYYFADFVRKGGEGTPQIRNPLFAEFFSVKGGRGTPQICNSFFAEVFFSVKGGGGTPLMDKIRKVVFNGFPKGLKKSSLNT